MESIHYHGPLLTNTAGLLVRQRKSFDPARLKTLPWDLLSLVLGAHTQKGGQPRPSGLGRAPQQRHVSSDSTLIGHSVIGIEFSLTQ